MAYKQPRQATIENARLLFKNFAGVEKQYNREGDRNFCIALEPDVAAQMEADGWPIKVLKARDDEETPQEYIKVKVKFGDNPPVAKLVTKRKTTQLDEQTVGMIDVADIANVDLILTQYHWDVNGSTGVTAYLKKIFVTLNEDELDDKYGDVCELGVDCVTPDGNYVGYPRRIEDDAAKAQSEF